MTKNRPSLLGNLVSAAALQLGNFVVPLVTLPYLARVLGVEAFGVYSLGFAGVMAVSVITEWGFPILGSKLASELAASNDDLGELVSSVVFAKFGLLCVVACFSVVGIELGFIRHDIGGAYLCFFGVLLGFTFNLSWLLQGLERLTRLAAAATVARLLFVPLTFIFVKSPSDVWLAALIQSAAYLAVAVVSIVCTFRFTSVAYQSPAINMVVARLREGIQYFLAAASINIYTASSSIIVGMILGPSSAALYVGADRLKSAAQNVFAPLSQVFLPRINRLLREDMEGAFRLISLSLIVFFAVGLLVSLGLATCSSGLVSLILGDKFSRSGDVLLILSVAPLLSSVSNALSIQIMVPFGLGRERTRILMLVTAVYLPVCFGLTFGLGIRGTAFSVLIAETLGLALFCACVKKSIGLRRFVFRPNPFGL